MNEKGEKEKGKHSKYNGYQDIMNKTWFCYNPVNGKPCGICNSCRYAIEEGMTERFSKSALIRYRL